MLGKSDGEMLKGEAPGWAVWKPEFALDFLAEHSIDFWLQSEDLPHPDNRVTINPDGQIVLSIQETNLEGHKRLTAKLEGHARRHRLTRSVDAPFALSGQGHSDRRHRAPGRNRSVRPRSEDIGAGCELQGARFGQSLCGRCKLLCVDCRREPQPDHHGERAARWRPFARTAGIERDREFMKAIAIVPGTAGSRLVDRPEPSITAPGRNQNPDHTSGHLRHRPGRSIRRPRRCPGWSEGTRHRP